MRKYASYCMHKAGVACGVTGYSVVILKLHYLPALTITNSLCTLCGFHSFYGLHIILCVVPLIDSAQSILIFTKLDALPLLLLSC